MDMHEPSLWPTKQGAEPLEVDSRVFESLFQSMVKVTAVNEHDYAIHLKPPIER